MQMARNGLADVEIIRADGAREQHRVAKGILMEWIRRMIAAPQALDTVNLRDGRVMLVDDTGMIDGRSTNPEATKLYHGLCRPGVTHPICGDVAITLDSNFA